MTLEDEFSGRLSLGRKQELFARCHRLLLQKAEELGYLVRQRELGRGPQQAKWNATHCARCKGRKPGHGRETNAGVIDHKFRPIGIETSLHCIFLAVDMYIRKPGGRILWASSAYKELGEFWESLHPLTYWGGRTTKLGDRLSNDGGHFAVTHGGRQ